MFNFIFWKWWWKKKEEIFFSVRNAVKKCYVDWDIYVLDSVGVVKEGVVKAMVSCLTHALITESWQSGVLLLMLPIKRF